MQLFGVLMVWWLSDVASAAFLRREDPLVPHRQHIVDAGRDLSASKLMPSQHALATQNKSSAATLQPNPADEAQLYQHLDSIVQQHGGVKEGHSNQIPELMTTMNALAANPQIKTICETGFNGGHGTLRWLLHSNSQAHVYSFDLGQHSYSRPAATWLQQSFPERLHVTWGDSTQTLPAFHLQHPEVKCNLVFVDGGHTHAVAAADLQNFMHMADPSYNVILMDDVYCNAPWCHGPSAAWAEIRQNSVVLETSSTTSQDGTRGFALGLYNVSGMVPSHL